MNKEIKEILDDLKFTNNDVMWCDKITLNVEQSNLLLDYITNLQEENKQYKEYIKELKDSLMNYHIKNNKLIIENAKLKDCESRIDKSNEYIKENTRWFDSEYAKVYGELCDCAGLKGDRLEVLINPSNLSKILGGDEDNEQIYNWVF